MFYEYNKFHKNKGAYEDRALYSIGIPFIKDGKVNTCDVITCACPNKRVGLYGPIEFDNTKVLFNRIKYVLDVAEVNNVKTLILGAFGCGIFMQDPSEVANVFKKLLPNYSFNNVIFAIPPGINFDIFYKIL